MRVPQFIAVTSLVLMSALAPALADKRVALVVGNAAYRHADKLADPVNDARSMRDALQKLSFDVVYGEELDLEGLRQAIEQFAGRVEGADVAIVYFAGHGATFGDTSYVAPVDAEFSNLAGARHDLVPVETLFGDLQRAKGVRLAILDACHDNGAERELKRRQASGGSRTCGLAPMQNVGELIVAYARQYAATAADDAGDVTPADPLPSTTSSARHSPFTAALVNNITTPGLDVTDMLRKVRRDVIAATAGKQRPEIVISTYVQYALAPAAPPASAAPLPWRRPEQPKRVWPQPAAVVPPTAPAPPSFPAPEQSKPSADPQQAAAATPLATAPDDLPAAVANLPAVAALQRNDPAAFERFRRRYAHAAGDARGDEVMTLVRNALRKSVKHLLAVASNDILVDITETSLAYLRGLQVTSPETCVWFSDDTKGASLTSNFARDLPGPFAREMSVFERIAGIDRRHTVAAISDEEVRPYFEKALATLRRQNARIDLQARGRLDPSEFAPFCALVIAFYQAMLDLPQDEKIKALRYLYAKAAVNADRDPSLAANPAAGEMAWSIVKDAGNAEQLRQFIAQFPASQRRPEAEERIKALVQTNAAMTQPVRPDDAALTPQKAVLHEEDPATPNGGQFVGTATWHTEQIAPAPGQKPEVVLRGDIEIPEQKVSVRMSLRRNEDKRLPASHTAEITFMLPPDFPHVDIRDVPGIMMQEGETNRGIELKGVAARVTDNFFIVGLSSNAADAQRNARLLKERSWFDIPVIYGDGKRAFLAIDKGPPGERAFSQAFAAWEHRPSP